MGMSSSDCRARRTKASCTSRRTVPSAAHYLEDAPAATDKGHPHGSGVPAASRRFPSVGVDEYIDLVIDYIEHLRPDLVLERFVSQSPKELLIAPDWGLKNYESNHRVQKRMKELGAYQGKKYEM